MSNIIDGININLKGVSLKWISEYIQRGDPTNFTDEAKITSWERVISVSEQLVLLPKRQQEKEKRKREIEHFPN